MKKFVKVFSWLFLIGGPVVAVLWSQISPSTAADSAGNASAPYILTVFGMMLLGLVGFIVTHENTGGNSGPPFM